MRRVRRQFPRPDIPAGRARVGRGLRALLVVPSAVVVGLLAAAVPALGAEGDPLPEGYAYEQVSPASTNGQRVLGSSFSPDELSVMTLSTGGYAGTENLPDLISSYVATRGSSGWYSTPINPPARDFPLIGGFRGVIDYTSDLSRSLWYPTLAQDKGTDRFTPVIREADGTFTIAGPTNTGGISEYPVGTSGDLDTIVLQTQRRTGILTDGTTDTRSANRWSLVVVRRSESGEISVEQLAYRNSATMSTSCTIGFGSDLGSRGSISADGEKIFFAPSGTGACATATVKRVWAKVGSADPIDLSATQCTDTCGSAAASHFAAASRDGNRVYFTTAQKLVNDDQDTSARVDLYEYDFEDPDAHLKPVTAGPFPDGAGVVSVPRVSDDGSYVYFVANGRPLAGRNPEGALPQLGVNNLYVAHRTTGAAHASIKFVGELDPSDTQLTGQGRRPAVTSTDGRFLLFPSRANLTGERLAGDSHLDAYRYDAVRHKLIRIWTDDPANNGASRVGEPYVNSPYEDPLQQQWHRNWPISDDGKTIAFDTTEPLSERDVNGEVDAYMWREETGEVTLISDGESLVPSRFQAVSPSGGTVLFTSSAAMVPSHRTGASALFAVRRGGGFPVVPPDDHVPCVGDACQGPSASAPELPGVGSVDFGSDGSVPLIPDLVRVSVGVSRLEAVTGSAARLRVRVPAAGRILVSGSAVRRAGASASKAGVYTVRIALGWRARQQLKKRKTLKVSARVAYRAKDGQSAGKTIAVTFKQPKGKRAATKKGGR